MGSLPNLPPLLAHTTLTTFVRHTEGKTVLSRLEKQDVGPGQLLGCQTVLTLGHGLCGWGAALQEHH